MAQKIQTSFKIDCDNLNIWINDYNKRWLIHFRQNSGGESGAKNHYLFTPACNITDLKAICLCLDDPNFKRATAITNKTMGATYLIEFVKMKTADGKYHLKMQNRGTDLWLTITDVKQFKDILAKANTAYLELFTKQCIQIAQPALYKAHSTAGRYSPQASNDSDSCEVWWERPQGITLSP